MKIKQVQVVDSDNLPDNWTMKLARVPVAGDHVCYTQRENDGRGTPAEFIVREVLLYEAGIVQVFVSKIGSAGGSR